MREIAEFPVDVNHLLEVYISVVIRNTYAAVSCGTFVHVYTSVYTLLMIPVVHMYMYMYTHIHLHYNTLHYYNIPCASVFLQLLHILSVHTLIIHLWRTSISSLSLSLSLSHTHTHTHTQSESVSQFDERLTAPVFGFSSVDEYYRAARNSDKLHKISVPYISIVATDDPFVPHKCE